jgi:hypothetical protein
MTILDIDEKLSLVSTYDKTRLLTTYIGPPLDVGTLLLPYTPLNETFSSRLVRDLLI